jgi:hypothetical protein
MLLIGWNGGVRVTCICYVDFTWHVKHYLMCNNLEVPEKSDEQARFCSKSMYCRNKSKRVPSIFNDESIASFICLRRHIHVTRKYSTASTRKNDMHSSNTESTETHSPPSKRRYDGASKTWRHMAVRHIHVKWRASLREAWFFIESLLSPVQTTNLYRL